MVRRVLTRLLHTIDLRQVIVIADQGFADVALLMKLEQFGVKFIIRVKVSTKVQVQGCWWRLGDIGFWAMNATVVWERFFTAKAARSAAGCQNAEPGMAKTSWTSGTGIASTGDVSTSGREL